MTEPASGSPHSSTQTAPVDPDISTATEPSDEAQTRTAAAEGEETAERVAAAAEAQSEEAAHSAETANRSARSLGTWILATVLGLVTIGGVAAAAVATLAIVEYLQGDAGRAEVGDCLNDAPAPEQLRRVDCEHADAAWVVAHRVSGVAEEEFADPQRREELCRPADEWQVAFWLSQEPTSLGDVMCLRTR